MRGNVMHDDLKQALYLIADQMRGMGAIGKHFSSNPYEIERAERMRELAAQLVALIDEDRDLTDVRAIFDDEMLLRVSPAIGTDAAVFNDRGDLLLIQRRDSEQWALPGGLAEIGRTLSESALLELWEEAGLRGRSVRLLGAFDGRLWGSRAKVHFVHVVFEVHCEVLEPAPGFETLDARFFPADALPELFGGHVRIVPLCFALRDSVAHFDPATSEGIDLPVHQRSESDQQRRK
jgi:8-oxo-dGTP pyrophosphatase MutT (NUDIX family)